MTTLDAETLRDVRDRHEVAIRTGRHPDSNVVVWAVAVDDAVFVRSARGAKGRWYKDLAGGDTATLEAGSRRLAVRATSVDDPAAIERVSGEYRRKYGASPYLQSVLRPEVVATTLRLEPR
ncbi:hypothetical protein BH10PSE6_BH10PSE6_29270 [soil metagenome]